MKLSAEGVWRIGAVFGGAVNILEAGVEG